MYSSMQGYQSPRNDEDSADISLLSPRNAQFDTDEETAQKNSVGQMKILMEFYGKKAKQYSEMVAASEEQATHITSKMAFYISKFDRWKKRFNSKRQGEEYQDRLRACAPPRQAGLSGPSDHHAEGKKSAARDSRSQSYSLGPQSSVD